MKTEFQQTAASAGIIGLASFGGALVGFILQLLVAFYFGAGSRTDAFFMAQDTSEMLSKLLLGGSITAVFLPMFVERIGRDQRENAWHLALNLLHLTAAIFIAAIFILAFFAEPFIRFIAPGFDKETSALTVQLLRVLLPSFLFLFLVELTTSMLHSLKRFVLPAALRLVAPITSITAILILVQTLGIYALAIGVVAGSILQLVLLFLGLRRQGLSYRFVFQPLDPAIKKLARLVYPFAFSVLVTQAAGVVYRILVSELSEGSLASIKFAEKITRLLATIFLASVTTVIFPILSEKASRNDFTGMRETIAGAIRLVVFITVPVIVGIALLRDPIISFLYQRGSFTAEDAAMTSIALLFLVIGLTTNGISSILSHATLALQKTSAAVAVTIASQAVAIYLFILLVPFMQHAGLALASSLVPLSVCLLNLLYLSRFIPNITSIFWHRTHLKTFALTAVMAIIVYSLPPANYKLAFAIPLAALVYFVGAYLWKIPEMREVLALVQGKMGKWKNA